MLDSENIIDHLRHLPKEERPAQRGQAPRNTIKEGAIATASRELEEAAMFDFDEPWEKLQD